MARPAAFPVASMAVMIHLVVARLVVVLLAAPVQLAVAADQLAITLAVAVEIHRRRHDFPNRQAR